jgi:hypothetical protein
MATALQDQVFFLNRPDMFCGIMCLIILELVLAVQVRFGELQAQTVLHGQIGNFRFHT